MNLNDYELTVRVLGHHQDLLRRQKLLLEAKPNLQRKHAHAKRILQIRWKHRQINVPYLTMSLMTRENER